jgi:serine/threonine protein kinase
VDTGPDSEALHDVLAGAFGGGGEASDSELRRARASARAALFGLSDSEELLSVGRYRLLANVGQGGLGSVWAAHDPHLDRVVALKLLRAESLRRHPRARAQLLAEAAIMARLTHPNVVRVYDLGEVEGELFVAMEYVEGQTLRTWQLQAEHRDWRALLEVYLQAGEGLAAAHEAGLVHGDFKPDNVLIGSDGRVLVSDFAVTSHLVQARAEAQIAETQIAETQIAETQIAETQIAETQIAEAETGPREGETPSSRVSVETGLAGRSVAIMGTPTYMAPEQLEGEQPEPRSDQFAFCVALWEALCGQRPFVAASPSLQGLRAAISAGPRELEHAHEVPARLLSLLRRGLAERPEDRYPELGQLLVDLRGVLGRRRRTLVGLGVLALLIAGFAGVSYGLSVEPEAPEQEGCPIEATATQLRWPGDSREALADRLAVSTLDEGAQARVLARLDRYAERWEAARGQTCALLVLEGDDGVSAFHDRALCMYAGAASFTTSVETLLAPEAELRLVAQPVADELPDPLRCVSTSEQLHRHEAGPSLVQRRRLARAQALQRGQRPAEALAIVEELRAEAEAEGQRRVLALVELQRGVILGRMDRGREALAVLERAQALAELSDSLQTEALAALHCAAAHMRLDEDPAQVEAWAERGMYLADRVGDPGWVLEAKLLRGWGALRAGDGERALELHAAALAEAEAEFGPNSPVLAPAHDFIGTTYAELGEVELARRHHLRSIELAEEHYGPEHFEPSVRLQSSARAMRMIGERELAEAQLERAHAQLAELLGPDHPRTRAAARSLAELLFEAGEGERAEALVRGEDGPEVELMRARAALDAGELDRAQARLVAASARLGEREDPNLRVRALELEGAHALARGDAPGRREQVQALAEAIAILADLLAQPRHRVRAQILLLTLELDEGAPTSGRRERLEQLLATTPGLSAQLRARARVLLWRSAAAGEREAAGERAQAALRRAYGPEYPLRRVFSG